MSETLAPFLSQFFETSVLNRPPSYGFLPIHEEERQATPPPPYVPSKQLDPEHVRDMQVAPLQKPTRFPPKPPPTSSFFQIPHIAGLQKKIISFASCLLLIFFMLAIQIHFICRKDSANVACSSAVPGLFLWIQDRLLERSEEYNLTIILVLSGPFILYCTLEFSLICQVFSKKSLLTGQFLVFACTIAYYGNQTIKNQIYLIFASREIYGKEWGVILGIISFLTYLIGTAHIWATLTQLHILTVIIQKDTIEIQLPLGQSASYKPYDCDTYLVTPETTFFSPSLVYGCGIHAFILRLNSSNCDRLSSLFYENEIVLLFDSDRFGQALDDLLEWNRHVKQCTFQGP
jgi:hypothetical protein